MSIEGPRGVVSNDGPTGPSGVSGTDGLKDVNPSGTSDKKNPFVNSMDDLEKIAPEVVRQMEEAMVDKMGKEMRESLKRQKERRREAEAG